ncbi:hypothetical protein [Tissierella pigra]|uniref:Uncharacterized protein n=1 Tax=Tissierella pigra TaxID=2607614 RepID=A0A6N7XZ92_9FIRM|nr:hypothetical protein [Tissierella pigra]MSU01805.1 hypothetical protein [Tissierella pigra]
MKVKFKKWNCITRVGWHCNENLGIELIDEEDGGVIAKATINPDIELLDNQVAIKDYTENAGMVEALLSAGVISRYIKSVPAGFMMVPVYEISEEFKKEVERAEEE